MKLKLANLLPDTHGHGSQHRWSPNISIGTDQKKDIPRPVRQSSNRGTVNNRSCNLPPAGDADYFAFAFIFPVLHHPTEEGRKVGVRKLDGGKGESELQNKGYINSVHTLCAAENEDQQVQLAPPLFLSFSIDYAETFKLTWMYS